MKKEEVILLSHGDGGLLTYQLLHSTFFPFLKNQWLEKEGDAAVIDYESGRLAFTTDSFVVSPLFFPGGDIGKLAVCGTVNDLVVSGAFPQWLSAAFIIPEGMEAKTLEEIVCSLSRTAGALNLPVVAGDTKVVTGSDPENLFISMSGIGCIMPQADFSPQRIEPSDLVIITGSIGDHGAAILATRLGIDEADCPRSDCAPLVFLLEVLHPYFPFIKVMRDPTRGGIATTLKEIAQQGKVNIYLEEERVVVDPKVRALAGILGVDPYYLASEGKALIITKREKGEEIVRALRGHPLGRQAAVIGEVEPGKGELLLRTEVGGIRPLPMLSGTPLPRIC